MARRAAILAAGICRPWPVTVGRGPFRVLREYPTYLLAVSGQPSLGVTLAVMVHIYLGLG